jgi:hypothetical protein
VALRLILDAVRRKWITIGFVFFQAFLYRNIGWDAWPRIDPLAFLLMFVAFLAMAAGAILESRELWQLPVSRRTRWLARWWLSTAGPVLAVIPAASLAQWFHQSPRPGVEQIAITATMAFLYCGCVMALAATRFGRWGDKPLVMPAPPAEAVARPPITPVTLRWVIARALVRALPMAFVALLLPVVAPFVLARYLPHTWSSMDAMSAALVLLMAAATIWGYRYQPALTARPHVRIRRANAPRAGTPEPRQVPASASSAKIAAAPRFVDRLTGWRLPLWQAARRCVLTYVTLLGLGIAWWWVASFYRSVPALAVLLRNADMLPLSSPTAHVTEPITMGVLFVVVGMQDIGLVANMRPLRALPLSSTRLSCIPLALGLIAAATLWMVLFVLQILVLRTMPVSWRPDLFVAFMALTALSHVLRMTLPGSQPVRTMVSMAPLGIIWWLPLVHSDSFRTDLIQPAMFIGGLLVLVVSFLVMRRAVTRGSRIYRTASTAAF